MSQYYTIEQVAATLQVHKETIYRLIKGRKLTASKIGYHWRVSEASLERYIESRTLKCKIR